jgi:hypothetical protein
VGGSQMAHARIESSGLGSMPKSSTTTPVSRTAALIKVESGRLFVVWPDVEVLGLFK